MQLVYITHAVGRRIDDKWIAESEYVPVPRTAEGQNQNLSAPDTARREESLLLQDVGSIIKEGAYAFPPKPSDTGSKPPAR